MSDTSIVAFLGDRDRTFDLAPHVLELERVTDSGVGALIKRVVAADFKAADLPAIARLALIGGGATPHEAATIVAVYVEGRPLAEGHALATTILMALWAGKPPAPDAVAAPTDLFVTLPDGSTIDLSAEAA